MSSMTTKDVFQIWTWMASLGFLAMLQQLLPREYTDRLWRKSRLWIQWMSPYMFCDVPEFENSISNSLYQALEVYINSLRAEGAQHLTLSKSKNSKAMTLALAHDQRTFDTFDRAKLEWVHIVDYRQRPMWTSNFETQSDERRKYMLQINKKDKERVLNKYIEHIEARALELKLASRELLMYTNTSKEREFFERSRGPWQSVPFKHPSKFDTLALDGDLKSQIIADLDNFAANEEYYKRIGRTWKRGYLLYGPPGTGKSSMIAAIANKMHYDVYDLELTEVTSNSELRKLLLSTSNKAVIVIEDIDCSLDLSGQRKKKKSESTTDEKTPTRPPLPGMEKKEEHSKVTLSGLLNFVDGLWSCCGSERIFIFTTNFKEKLDPALLRAGRMDMRIHLNYCTFSAFKQLAKNYLEITEHELFEKLEAAFVGSFMTPAEVSEELILNQTKDVDVVLEKLIAALDEHRVDPATVKENEDEDQEKAGEKAPAVASADTKSEDQERAPAAASAEAKSDDQKIEDSGSENRSLTPADGSSDS